MDATVGRLLGAVRAAGAWLRLRAGVVEFSGDLPVKLREELRAHRVEISAALVKPEIRSLDDAPRQSREWLDEEDDRIARRLPGYRIRDYEREAFRRFIGGD